MRCRAVTVLCAGLLWAACSAETRLADGMIARIADRQFAYADFEEFLDEGVGEGATGLDNDVLAALFEQFLDEELLRELAMDRGLVHAAASRRRAMEALLADQDDVAITQEAIAAYYQEHLESYRRGERVRLRQLLLEDREQADRVIADLAAGLDFVEVAEQVGGEDAVASLDQGELSREDLPVEFVEPIFALQPGETSPALEADYGFHIFQVVERRAADVVPLEVATAEIRRHLETTRTDELVRQMLDEARQKYNVHVAATSLPFRYPATSSAASP